MSNQELPLFLTVVGVLLTIVGFVAYIEDFGKYYLLTILGIPLLVAGIGIYLRK